ncbi:MAG: hypothetical protein N4A61_10465 [Pelagimonas sp.]|jgi:hypothetical protein|nr:hypothetical protein [Pelagimonas sp.]
MLEKMFGVVLWTDTNDSKAVIWCEDHGDLAYYTAPEQMMHDGVSLDPGDLIQFDCREGPDHRRARNLERVVAGHAPNLPSNLGAQERIQRVKRGGQPRATPSRGSNVVAFPKQVNA